MSAYVPATEAIGRLVIAGYSVEWVNHRIIVSDSEGVSIMLGTVRDGSSYRTRTSWIDEITEVPLLSHDSLRDYDFVVQPAKKAMDHFNFDNPHFNFANPQTPYVDFRLAIGHLSLFAIDVDLYCDQASNGYLMIDPNTDECIAVAVPDGPACIVSAKPIQEYVERTCGKQSAE